MHNVIVAGESYGQGSSREHAAMCPMYLGVKAVIAKSFERIHAANLVNFGILPLVFEDPADYDSIEAGDRLSAAGWRDAVAARCAGHGAERAHGRDDRVRLPAFRDAAGHRRGGRPSQLRNAASRDAGGNADGRRLR